MKKLLRILTVDSLSDLFRYKSFLFLIFILIAADRIVHRLFAVEKTGLSEGLGQGWGFQAADTVFNKLPGKVLQLLMDYRTFLVIAGLFVLKQIISMWPSSDMRRMHRKERKGFGLLGSLLALRWEQVLWDAIAIGSICGLIPVWGDSSS